MILQLIITLLITAPLMATHKYDPHAKPKKSCIKPKSQIKSLPIAPSSLADDDLHPKSKQTGNRFEVLKKKRRK